MWQQLYQAKHILSVHFLNSVFWFFSSLEFWRWCAGLYWWSQADIISALAPSEPSAADETTHSEGEPLLQRPSCHCRCWRCFGKQSGDSCWQIDSFLVLISTFFLLYPYAALNRCVGRNRSALQRELLQSNSTANYSVSNHSFEFAFFVNHVWGNAFLQRSHYVPQVFYYCHFKHYSLQVIVVIAAASESACVYLWMCGCVLFDKFTAGGCVEMESFDWCYQTESPWQQTRL